LYGSTSNYPKEKNYKKFIFKDDTIWSDSQSFVSKEILLSEKELPVLERMKLQLERSGISQTEFTKKPDLMWAIKNINNIVNQNFDGEFILLFPFCSPKLVKKKWPYFNDLLKLLKRHYKSQYNIAIAPGPNEIHQSREFDTNIILNKGLSLNLVELISLIHKAKYIVSNDTGPAHICAHLNKKGLALFGSHTTPEKVSIESSNFRALTVKNLSDLDVDTVMKEVRTKLN